LPGLLVLHDRAESRRYLAADHAEERRHAPVIVLAPFFIGVMVALRTRHADAEEKLAGVIDELLWLEHVAIPYGRRGLGFVADRRQDFARELIVGLVVGDTFANPVVKREGAERPVLILIVVASLDAQDIRPAVGEVVAVLRRLDQAIDQLVALVGVLIGQEFLHLLRRRQG